MIFNIENFSYMRFLNKNKTETFENRTGKKSFSFAFDY